MHHVVGGTERVGLLWRVWDAMRLFVEMEAPQREKDVLDDDVVDC
jgi:hypothetical protein